MNSVILIGNLGADPELRFIAGSGKAVANFQMAVKRPFSKDNVSDWFKVIAWGKTAENTANYLHKGSQVAVKGYLTTRNYEDKEGVKRYVTEIVADQVQFLDGAKGRENTGQAASLGQEFRDDGFQSIEDNMDFDVPF